MQQCCSSAGRCTWFAIGRLTWRTLRTPLPKCTEPWILSLFLLSSLRMLTKEGGLKKGERLFRRTCHSLSILSRSKVHAFLQATIRIIWIIQWWNLSSSLSFSFIIVSSSSSSSSRWEDLEKSWTRCYNSWTKEDDRTKSKRYVCVCTNLGNSTAPRCTFRFRDTDLPRKCRCARPPNRNYDNCTCNRHEWAKECHPTGRITSDSKEDSMGWISLTRINGADEKRTMTILKNVS